MIGGDGATVESLAPKFSRSVEESRLELFRGIFGLFLIRLL